MAAQGTESARLKRAVILLAAAGAFFAVSLLANLAQGGGLRAIDIVLPLWALLFLAYWRRWRAAVTRDREP